MAVSTSYRLPGVYSEETTGPFINAGAGGNATLALVGPALGYMTASQQAYMSGTDEVALNEAGIIPGSVSMISRTSGASYVNGTDFVERTDIDGNISVVRNIQTLSLNKSSVIGMEHVYYTAESVFSIMQDASGDEITGYPISGTVTVVYVDDEAGDVTLVEGEDYEIDYSTGLLGALSGGKLADAEANAHTLLINFDWTTAEPMQLVGESAWPFDHNYIAENGLGDVSARIVSCPYTDGEESYPWGSTPGSQEAYIEGADFVIDYQTGRITKTETSRIPDFDVTKANYMYIEFAYDAVRDGENVLISYAYQDADFDVPHLVASYSEVANIYGSAWDSETGDIVSPLSLAAYLAFQNGASFMYITAVRGSVTVETVYDEDTGEMTTQMSAPDYPPSAWEDAFAALSLIDGIDVIVPIDDDLTTFAFATSHLTQMKANQDERVLICGLDGTTTQITQAALIARANALNNADVSLVGPGSFRFRNPIRNTIDVIAGYYMAAAIGGYLASVPQYTPLTRKVISGFYSANEYATKLSKTTMCANGVMYVDEVNGQMRILHGTSTNPTSTITRETNVQLTKYYIIKTLRRMFDNGYVGEIITNITLASMRSLTSTMLINMRDNNYMTSFDDLSVFVDQQVPTQVNVVFTYVPVYAMNYIQISFAIDTSTGFSSVAELY